MRPVGARNDVLLNRRFYPEVVAIELHELGLDLLQQTLALHDPAA